MAKPPYYTPIRGGIAVCHGQPVTGKLVWAYRFLAERGIKSLKLDGVLEEHFPRGKGTMGNGNRRYNPPQQGETFTLEDLP